MKSNEDRSGRKDPTVFSQPLVTIIPSFHYCIVPHMAKIMNIRATVRTCLTLAALHSSVALSSVAFVAAADSIELQLDARELPRNLLHSQLTLSVKPSTPLKLWFPKWVPGIHGPRGPIQNVAGIRMTDLEENPVEWRRDDTEVYLLHVDVPSGVERIRVEIDYIASQPSTNSRGVDSYGNSLVGIISWNTIMLYPDAVPVDDVQVTVKLKLPEGWRYGTSLRTKSMDGSCVEFASTTVRELIDSPVLCGRHFRTIDLQPKNAWPTYMHLASETQSAIEIDDGLIGNYRRLVDESAKMFVHAPFDEYHFLVVCSDDVGSMGLEHLRSSLNGVEERGLIDPDKRKLWPAYLLPHEFVHAWCGKYRQPAGMATPDYHTPKQTKLLWIYEGLTQYLGEVLTVRSGLVGQDEYRQQLEQKISWLQRMGGREWRSLEDTAIASHTLRARSPSWSLLRRRQDYYNEVLLTWMDIDARIRLESDGQRSLDDFCQSFLGKPSEGKAIRPFDVEEVYAELNKLLESDWKAYFDHRVNRPLNALPLDVVPGLGYRLQYTTELSDYRKAREKEYKYLDVGDSLGMNCRDDGQVRGVVPRGTADQAHVAPGMKIIGVNGRKFSIQRLKDAVADSPVKRQIELLVLDGEQFRTITLNYAEGPKYVELTRDPNRRDVLGKIMKSRAE